MTQPAHTPDRKRQSKKLEIKRSYLFYAVSGFFIFYFLLFLPALWTNQIPYFMDIVTQFFPIKVFIGGLWQHLKLPLWNSTYYGGVPLLANPQWGVLYPGNFPFFLYRSGWMYLLTFVIHSVIGAGGVWLLCQRFITSPFSLIAPVVFLFSGYLWAHYAFGAYILALCWMPFIFWAHDRYIYTNQKHLLILGGLLFSLQLLAGAPQLSFYFVLAFFFIVVVYPLFVSPPAGIAQKHFWLKSILFFIATTLIGTIISSPQLVAVLGSTGEIGRRTELPLREVLAGTLTLRDYISACIGGTGVVFEDAETTAYIGLSVLFLVLVGGIDGLSRPRRAPLFSYGLLCVVLLASASRLLAPLQYHIFPFYAKFHDPKRVLGIVMILLPIFSARGLELLYKKWAISDPIPSPAEGNSAKFEKHKITIISGIAFAVLAVLVVLNGHRSFFDPIQNFTQLGWIRITTLPKPFIISSVSFLFLIGLIILTQKRKRTGFLLLVLISIIVMVDLIYFSFTRIDIKTIPIEKVFNKNNIPAPLLVSGSEYRFITYDPTMNYSYDYLRSDFSGMVLPDCASYYGLQDFQGYDPWKPRRYELYLTLLNKGFIVPYQRHFGLVRNLWWSPLLGRAGVKFVIGDPGYYHLPLYPRRVLSPSQSQIFTPERIFKTTTMKVGFVTRTDNNEQSLVNLTIRDLSGVTIAELMLGTESKEFKVLKGNINKCELTPKRLHTPEERLAEFIWDCEFEEALIPAEVSITNVSQRHNIMMTEIGFIPQVAKNHFVLVSGKSNETTSLWALKDDVSPMLSWAEEAYVANSTSEALDILDRISQTHHSTVVIEDRNGILSKRGTGIIKFSRQAKLINAQIGSGKIRATITTSDSPALLIIRQAYSRYWQAILGERKLTVFPCDVMFSAVIIPPDTNAELLFIYSPPFIAPLLVLSALLTLCLLLILIRHIFSFYRPKINP